MTANRLRRILTLLLGLYFALDALWMLASPMNWYDRAGVAFTGPANIHFIRDIGCAFLASAMSLLWFAKSPRAWPAALAGVSFLVLHVFVHLWDTFAGRESFQHLLAHEMLAVIFPALLGVWIVWPRPEIKMGTSFPMPRETVYPVKWNHKFIDLPRDTSPKQPTFTGDVVTGIVAKAEGMYRVLFVLCAAAGLRIGEALGIDIKNVSSDCLTIKLKQKAWRGEIHDYLKTDGACTDGSREIDLHPAVASMLKEHIGTRQSGLLFCSRSGKQLWQSNILRRGLHPILKKLEWKDAELGIDKAGNHAFRRFRNTYLRNYTATPGGLIQFWMGHRCEGMSGLYDKIRHDVKFRKEVVKKAGLGFEIPSKSASNGRNGRKNESEPILEMAAST